MSSSAAFMLNTDVPSIGFTIGLVRALETHLAWLEMLWAVQSLSSFQFVHLIYAVTRASFSLKQQAAVTPYARMPKSDHDVDDITLPPHPDAVPELAASWERRMISEHNKIEHRGSFDTGDAVQYWLLATFNQIPGPSRTQHTFSEFRAYIIESTMGGKNSKESEVKSYSLTRVVPCSALWRMHRMEVYDEYQSIIMASAPEGEQASVLRVVELTTLQAKSSRKLNPEQGLVQCFEVVQVQAASSVLAGGVRTKAILIFVATSDGFLRAYDYDRDLSLSYAYQFNDAQTAMFYSRKTGFLVLGSSKGLITVPTIAVLDAAANELGEMSNYFAVHLKMPSHTDKVTCMETDAMGETVFTASLDRTIVQFHPRTGEVVRRLTGHKMGVLGMCYNRFYHSLVTCGMEYVLYTWPLEVLTPQPILLEDQSSPYTRSVLVVRTVPQKPMVISMDAKGMFKIWDLRSCRAVATVFCEPEMSRSELEYLWWPWFTLSRRSMALVTAANRKCYIFEYDIEDTAGAYSAHETSLVGCAYDAATNMVLSGARADMSLWSAESLGSVNHIRDVDADGVTRLMAFPTAAAVVVGTSTGALKVYSTASFAVMALWVHQSQDAISVLYDMGNNTFAAIGGKMGRCEVVHFNSKTQQLHGRAVEKEGSPVQCTAVASLFDGSLVLGEVGNQASVWSLQPECSPPHKTVAPYTEILKIANFQTDCRVTVVVTIPDCPAFITGDSGGWVNIFAYDVEKELIWRLTRFQLNRGVPSAAPPAVTTACLCQTGQHLLLATGDDFGNLSIYDPTVALGKRNAGTAHPSAAFLPTMQNLRQEVSMPTRISQAEIHPEASITTMQYIAEYQVLLTGGTDCRLQLSTLGGSHLGFFLLTKIGLTNEESGATGLKPNTRYNDLPVPYGAGSTDGGFDALQAVQQGDVGAGDDDSLAASIRAARDRSGALRVLRATDDASKKRRRRLPPIRSQSVIERAPVVILPHTDEILYHVPQYIGLDKLESSERPNHVTYLPSVNVEKALYGPTADFWSFNHSLVRLATDRETEVKGEREALSPTSGGLESGSPLRPLRSPPPSLLKGPGSPVKAPNLQQLNSSPSHQARHFAGVTTSRTPEPAVRRGELGPLEKRGGTLHKAKPLRSDALRPKPVVEVGGLRATTNTEQVFFVPAVRSLAGTGNAVKTHHAKAF